MFLNSYKKALEVLTKKPFTLWGLSLMSGLLTAIAYLVLGVIPALAVAVVYLLTSGMAKIYLDGLEEKSVCSDQLFAAFNKNCFRIAGAMAWRTLWIIIWALIPVVGPIIAIIKSYSYRFVPYILVTNPDIKATEALKLSMKLTKGKKGQMFLADLCFGAGVFLVVFILTLFSVIPIIGILFMFVLFIVLFLLIAFSAVFQGLYQAYFFELPKTE